MSYVFFFFSSRRRHTRCGRDWSSDVCSSDLVVPGAAETDGDVERHLQVRGGRHVLAHERLDRLLLARCDLEDELVVDLEQQRSEERRVGKECRSRWVPDHSKHQWKGCCVCVL